MASPKLILMTALAMLAFAANSVLARLAFATAGAEPMAYTGIRLASGALALVLILALRGRRLSPIGGSWRGAAALFAYAMLFSIAYVMLGAAVGALILFASVQIGIGLAFAALVYLVSPGLVAPHPLGAVLMAGAGLAWAVYTLIGRGSATPLVDTAGNFVRTVPVALLLIVAGSFAGSPSPLAIGYAVISGVVASGLGYAIWYTALPHLTRTRAAIVQLTVPAIAAAGGVLLIAESDRYPGSAIRPERRPMAGPGQTAHQLS